MWDTTSKGNARYWCRVCNHKGFAEALTDEEMAAAKAKRMEQKMAAEAERQEKIKQIQQEAYWRGWHDAMDAAARQAWANRGLPDPAQDYLELGYTSRPPRGSGSALTIPYHDDTWSVVNLQWRYTDHSGNRNKYHNLKGMSLPIYRTDHNSTSKNLLVVEGAIKAGVVWWRMAVVAGMDYHVIGLPSSTPSADVLDEAAAIPYDKVFIMTDPDTYGGNNCPAKRIGSWFDEALYVTLPGKPDDLLNDGWSAKDIQRYIGQAAYV